MLRTGNPSPTQWCSLLRWINESFFIIQSPCLNPIYALLQLNIRWENIETLFCLLDNTDMDLNEIRVFVKVVQAGSFNQAAKQLRMPNSTVSAKVSALERRLGVTLLQRTTRKLHLTQDGEAYFRHSLQGLEEILKAEAEVRSSQREPQGILRVTAPIDMGNNCFVDLISRFRTKYPKVG